MTSEKIFFLEAFPRDPSAELFERFDLNLADALARDAQLGCELIERRDVATIQSVTALDDEPLSLGQLGQPFADETFDAAHVQHQFRRDGCIIGDAVPYGER